TPPPWSPLHRHLPFPHTPPRLSLTPCADYPTPPHSAITKRLTVGHIRSQVETSVAPTPPSFSTLKTMRNGRHLWSIADAAERGAFFLAPKGKPLPPSGKIIKFRGGLAMFGPKNAASRETMWPDPEHDIDNESSHGTHGSDGDNDDHGGSGGEGDGESVKGRHGNNEGYVYDGGHTHVKRDDQSSHLTIAPRAYERRRNNHQDRRLQHDDEAELSRTFSSMDVSGGSHETYGGIQDATSSSYGYGSYGYGYIPQQESSSSSYGYEYGSYNMSYTYPHPLPIAVSTVSYSYHLYPRIGILINVSTDEYDTYKGKAADRSEEIDSEETSEDEHEEELPIEDDSDSYNSDEEN
ncbi:hypothetical protein Taro_028581, partial [Colocasia esculenta]|nr:hypothetical protein [Colocasia esculenta]